MVCDGRVMWIGCVDGSGSYRAGASGGSDVGHKRKWGHCMAGVLPVVSEARWDLLRVP